MASGFALINDFSVASWIGNASLIFQALEALLPWINGALRHFGVPTQCPSLHSGRIGPARYDLLHPEVFAEVYAPNSWVVDDVFGLAARQHFAFADDVGVITDT